MYQKWASFYILQDVFCVPTKLSCQIKIWLNIFGTQIFKRFIKEGILFFLSH